LLTGRHPFDGVGLDAQARGESSEYTGAQLAARKWPICPGNQLPSSGPQNRIIPASEINRDLAEHHPRVERLLNKCLANDQSSRFANARVLLDGIEDYIRTSGTLSASDLQVIGMRQNARAASAGPVPPERAQDGQIADAAALIDQGKPDRAVGMADAVLRASPQSVPALLMKARALTRIEGRLKDADAVCGAALALAPEDPTVYETLASIRDIQGKPTQAAGFRAEAERLRRAPGAKRTPR
jgi:Flp pilus assembly protein TadD